MAFECGAPSRAGCAHRYGGVDSLIEPCVDCPFKKDERDLIAPSADDATATAMPAIATQPGGLKMKRLSEVEGRSAEYVDKPLLQASTLHLLVGRKGMGKGTYLADVAA